MTTRTTFRIEGMGCQACVAAVRSALEDAPSVSVERVAIGTAEVRFDPDMTDRRTLRRTIEGAGYRVRDDDGGSDD